MSIFISQDFVADQNNSVEATDTDLKNPIIGYKNIVSSDTLVADEQDPNFPVENLFNPTTNQLWKGLTASTQYLTVTADGADTHDYIGIVGHNFHSQAIAASVEVDSGSGFEEVVTPSIPGTDGPLIFRYTGQTGSAIRLKMAAGDAPPEMAVIFVGKLLVLQRRIYVGHTPINYARETEIMGGRSMRGHYLGQVLLGQYLANSVDISNMTPDWYRAYMDPFVKACRNQPFFFAWRPSQYPDEVGYCWFTNTPKPQNQRSNGMMSISLALEGVAVHDLESLAEQYA